MINKLIEYFKSPNAATETPEGVCPNCWGQQKYGNQIREMFADKQIDVNNRQASYAFIQEFVIEHIDGIRLKKGNNGLECRSCKVEM